MARLQRSSRTHLLTWRFRPAFRLALLLASALALPSGAATQTPDSPALREGVHFALGAGSASVSATCSSCEVSFFDERLNGLSGVVQLGGAVTPQLVVAAEFFGWMNNDAPVYRRVAALSLVVLGYPSAQSGFFIKGGLGGLRAIVENDFVRGTTNTYTAQTGIGYDIPLSGVMVTPYLNYVRTFYGETDFNGVFSPEAVFPNAIQVGAALTIH